MSFRDGSYAVLSPLPFSSSELEKICNNIKVLENNGILTETKIKHKTDLVQCQAKFHWLKSGMEEPIYEITDSAKENAPTTVGFNKEVAEHCEEESFHLDMSYTGLISTLWKIPKKWGGVPEKIDKVMDRFVTIVVSRAFQSSTIEHDLFHNPYYFTQGFAFGKTQDALQNGIAKTCEKYMAFISLFRKLADWKSIALFRLQVKSTKERLDYVGPAISMSVALRNSMLNQLSDLERAMELNMLDCIVNDTLLWEVGDSL